MFGFDKGFAAFDVTPVENQFILEYMPAAKGDYVKVYLYGLMHCRHPQDEMSVTEIAHELGMTENDVMAAFRYWERRGLVRRVADKPPAFQYVSVVQCMMTGNALQLDPEYEAFGQALYEAFGNERELHGREISKCYEWVEELGLPTEVVIMLLRHMLAVRGKSFTMDAAEKLALMLADEKAVTIDDAEVILSRDKAAWEKCKDLLRHLGKRHNPSMDEINMYVKWTREWGYTHDAIKAACAETTRGTPNFAYLDGILRGMMQRAGKAMTSAKQVEDTREAGQTRVKPLKELLQVLNLRDVAINESMLSVYDDMRGEYPDEFILLAGRECARYGGAMDAVATLLKRWKREGITTLAQAQSYMRQLNGMNDTLRKLFDVWGVPVKTSDTNRAYLRRWRDELGFNEDFILFCAAFAAEAQRPMPYLDKRLTEYAAKGIRTEEAAAEDMKRWKAAHQNADAVLQRVGRVMREQQYTQREYEPAAELPDWMKQRMEEQNA